MHTQWLVVLCWICISTTTFAQTDSSAIKIFTPEWYAKFSPLAIFDTDGGISFSGEYVLPANRLGFQLEAQAILFDVYNSDGENSGFEAPESVIQSGAPLGIKLRPEVRYYIGGMKMPGRRRFNNDKFGLDPVARWRRQTRTYLAIDFLYKKIRRERLSEFNISNGGGIPAFQQRAVYADFKQVTGFDFKIGVITPVAGDHWFLEMYLGMGVRYKKFWYKNLPLGATDPERSSVSFDNGRADDTMNYPSLPAGIKVVYRF